MKTIEELEARLEVTTRERDEARAYAEDRNDEANKLQRFLNMAAAERDEARAEVERLREESATQADISSSTIARMKQQLREARAEVERLTDERDELLVRVADQGAELRATREAYTNVRKLADALRTAGITADDCRAVETLYAVAGYAGSHRIVETMRYLGAWIKKAKP